jgi:hypothetical protein
MFLCYTVLGSLAPSLPASANVLRYWQLLHGHDGSLCLVAFEPLYNNALFCPACIFGPSKHVTQLMLAEPLR